MKFLDFEFGYADADTEYIRIEKYFNNVFYDPKNYIDNLVNKWEFMVAGRKGVGKSAYSAKLRSLEIDGLYTNYLPLNEFEYSTFEKTSTDKNITGTQKFKDSWDFILLCLIYKILYQEANFTEHEKINYTISLLTKLGFSFNYDYKQFVSTLSKIKIGANLGAFDAAFEKEFGLKPNTYIERISSLNKFMIDSLEGLYWDNTKLLLLLDGVDDVLRFKKNRIEILASLIRSIDYLNKEFNKEKINAKIILFIRDEILFLVNDTDINKTKRDSSIRIDWTKNTNDLKEIIKLRFNFNKNITIEISDIEHMFPTKIKNKNFWDYLLELTLYKPRDIIQFFKICQELYPNKETLSFSEVNEVSKTYSSQYFMDEMKNELAGFVADDIITIIPAIFRKMNTKSFSINEFFSNIKEFPLSKEITIDNTKYLLYVLYEAGYVGQIIESRYKKCSVQFKYRNPTSQVDYNYKFIIHKGLHIGLGVII